VVPSAWRWDSSSSPPVRQSFTLHDHAASDRGTVCGPKTEASSSVVLSAIFTERSSSRAAGYIHVVPRITAGSRAAREAAAVVMAAGASVIVALIAGFVYFREC
jgi:hypothetical protein